MCIPCSKVSSSAVWTEATDAFDQPRFGIRARRKADRTLRSALMTPRQMPRIRPLPARGYLIKQPEPSCRWQVCFCRFASDQRHATLDPSCSPSNPVRPHCERTANENSPAEPKDSRGRGNRPGTSRRSLSSTCHEPLSSLAATGRGVGDGRRSNCEFRGGPS